MALNDEKGTEASSSVGRTSVHLNSLKAKVETVGFRGTSRHSMAEKVSIVLVAKSRRGSSTAAVEAAMPVVKSI